VETWRWTDRRDSGLTAATDDRPWRRCVVQPRRPWRGSQPPSVHSSHEYELHTTPDNDIGTYDTVPKGGSTMTATNHDGHKAVFWRRYDREFSVNLAISQMYAVGFSRSHCYMAVIVFLLVVNSNLVSEIRRLKCRKSTIFLQFPTPIPAKLWGVPFGVGPSCWGLQRERKG